jgi:GT2 family glycosyltransferase
MAQIGIAIGLPFGGRLVHPKWAVSMYTIDFPVSATKTLIMVENRPVEEARNMIVEQAKTMNCKYLFFLDDDVIAPRYAVLALGDILEKHSEDGVMVATGIYCTKNFAPAPLLFKDEYPGPYLDWVVNEQFEVDGAGAGCMLINMEVFNHLEPPYFRFTQEYKEVNGEPLLHVISEDLFFCQSVRKAGYKIMAHGAVICPHYCDTTKKFYELPKDSRPYKKELKRQQEEMEATKTQEV